MSNRRQGSAPRISCTDWDRRCKLGEAGARAPPCILKVAQKPLISSAPQAFRWFTDSIIHHSTRCNILSRKEHKMSQSFSNNYNSFNPTYINTAYINPTAADDRPNILAWLSPLDPKLRHQDIRDRRIESIGEWVLQTEEFRAWSDISEDGKSNNGVLFCYGNPGVGKTYIR